MIPRRRGAHNAPGAAREGGAYNTRFPQHPAEVRMGIQHKPKSVRNASKKRRKARKHKLRSSKKYRGGVR
jgi:hypothetical protein